MAFSQLSGKLAVERMHPVKVCFLRFGLSAPVCYGVMVCRTGEWRLPMTPGVFMMVLFIGVLGWGAGALLFHVLLFRDSMHRVVPPANSMSIWVVVLSIVFLKEPFFPVLAVVLVMLAAGTFLMAPSAASTRRWAPALPLAVLVSLFWSVNIVMSKVYIAGMPPSAFVFVKMVGGAAFALAFFPVERSRFNRPGFLWSAASAMLLVGADILIMTGLQGMPASIWSPMYASIIPFGFLMSVVALKEKPVVRNWLGMALIFMAAAVCGYFGAK